MEYQAKQGLNPGWPRLTLGTDNLVKADEITQERTKEHLIKEKIMYALKCGYRIFDTAESYGSLRALCLALADLNIARADVCIVYKFMPNQPVETLAHVLGEAIECAGGYLDVAMLHRVDEEKIVHPALELLQKLLTTHKIWHIGFSNVDHIELDMYISRGCRITFVQNKFTAYEQDEAMLHYCKDRSISYMGFGILRAMKVDEALAGEAKRLNCTPEQLLLAWALHMGVIQAVASSSLDNLLGNYGALKVVLDEHAVKFISSLAQKSPATLSPMPIQTVTTQSGIRPELLPFYNALRQLVGLCDKKQLGQHVEDALVEQSKTAVVVQWNDLTERMQQSTFDPDVKKFLTRFKTSSKKTLQQLMTALQQDTGFCTAGDKAREIIEAIEVGGRF